jgi:D-sedoheptulose 7-phosphate isomerase
MPEIKNYSDEIKEYFGTLQAVIDRLNLTEINSVLALLSEAYRRKKQIFIMGNGGSAATASHFVCDFNKGICEDKSTKFRMICLNDNVPTMMAIANDLDYESIFIEQLKNLMEPGDYVIGISGSGNSENVLRAIKYANEHQGVTIGFSGYSGGKLKDLTKFGVHVNINDMQIVEDIHMILDHLMMKVLKKNL